jgi:Ca2+-transporting ATPase
MKPWYAMDLEETAGNLQTDLKDGLTAGEAAERLARNGPNELIERGVKSPWKILLEQFTEIMVVILLISAAISIWLHETTDAIVILIIVVLNALLGFTQEYRAEKAMAALKKLAVPKVHVRRGGHLLEIPAREVVPGDLIQLDAGDVAPADGRLVESANLRLQESVLTGESEPVEKFVHPLGGDAVAVGDQRNMVFMGTVVTYGRGQAVITATGMNSELGKIADLLQSVGQEATPLQKRLQQLGKGLALAALGIVAVVFLLGLARGEDPRTMFQTAISMAVAAVPEGLPAVVTIALAFGAQRMLKRNALIRKLPAVETLGSTTVICSDKTGTLTENRMTVTVVDVAGNQVDFLEATRFYAPQVSRDERAHPMEIDSPAVLMALLAGALCNDAVIEENSQEGGNFTAVGDPTEGALVVAAARAGLWKADLEKTLPRVAEFPFDSERKRMTTAHPFAPDRLPATLGGLADLLAVAETGRACLAFTKGSVDGLLEISTRVWNEDHVEELDAAWRSRIEAANAEKAAKGMRVLGIALRLVECEPLPASAEELESDLVFVGLVGMIDPARPEVRQAVSVAKAAGVRPVMITGDHPLTAMSIARELGISDGKDLELTGKELATLPAEELQEKVARVSVYARVSPEHKLKIVQALQASGQIVAMTGDGVNDAPALKKADIGVAMGITGTDVSKEAADMVLLDDNFTTIVAAIEEGRRIYDNIRKFIKYTLTSNAGEIWVMLAGPFLGLPLPLTALQILWVNLVTDGLPGLALTAEPAEPDTMRRAPHPPDENIFSRGLVRDILWIGLLMAAVSLGVGLWAWWSGRSETWQTMVFTTLTLAQMGNVLAIRSDKYSLFQIGLLSNKALLGAVLLTFLLQMAVIYVPFLQAIFQTQPLPLLDLVVSLVSSLVVFVAIELVKWVGRRQVI